MKKTLIVLAIFASFQVANAQTNVNAVKKAVESAQAATQNAKKATKAATWLKLAQAYLDAYNAPTGSILPGSTQAELKFMMGNDKPTSSETVVLNNAQYTKEIYADKNLYFNGSGQLEIIEVTSPVYEDALDQALAAYQKAFEVDNGSKSKDISAGIKSVAEKMVSEAYTAYSLGDIRKAESFFEAAVAAAARKPYEHVDTSSLYNAAFTSWNVGEYGKAKSMFERCLNYNYYGEGGEVFAKLADCTTRTDTSKAGAVAAKGYLEEGFRKFPESQSILIGLINYYVNSGDDANKLFDLLDNAKKNEPGNASLYYVEGNAHLKLGEIEQAIESYRKCAEIDPDYEYGYIGEGQLHYNRAVEISEKAQSELDDAKYMALVQQFEGELKACIEPFEKAFELTKDDNVKSVAAEFLKNVYFRFRDQDPKYQAGYDKYSSFLK